MTTTITAGPERDDAGAVLTIDLAALAANWKALNARSGNSAAVVKANAYGIGIEEAAPALAKAGCRTFFVAHLSEAKRVRAVLPDVDVYVLNGLTPGTLPIYAEHRLRPVLGSPEEIAEWKGSGLPAALHVDTGMNRLGLRPEAFRAIAAEGSLRDQPLALLMSHFVESELLTNPVTLRQVALFAELRPLMPSVPASLANSSGHFLEPKLPYELARAGVALYGGNPLAGRENPMAPVVRLDVRIVQIREVPQDETVGYSATWTAPRPTTLAIASIGYADGLFRAGGSVEAMINGARCRVVGRISMDLTAIDVTAMPVKPKRGDTATFIGEGITVDEVAGHAGTIGYEVLTSLGRRYHRVYLSA